MAAWAAAPVDTMIVMEEFGKALVVEPYVPTVVIGGGFLKHGGSDAQKDEWLAKIAAGETHHRLRLRRAARAATISPI